MVLSYLDVEHHKCKEEKEHLYKIFKTWSLFYLYPGSNTCHVHYLEIYFGIGIFIGVAYVFVGVLLFVAAILRSKRGLYVWLFLTIVVYLGGTIFICIPFNNGSWMNFIVIIVLTSLTIWGFTVVLAFISEMNAQVLKAAGTSPSKNEETQTFQLYMEERYVVVEVQDADEKRKAMDIVSKFSENPDADHILNASKPSSSG
jgi:hypothetical protein